MVNQVDSLFENYKNFRNKVDQFLYAAGKVYLGDMVCKKGCASCCRHLTLFPVEAFYIRFALESLPPEHCRMIQERALAMVDSCEGECPLLYAGECLLYGERPLICRTHGFPILTATEEGVIVDHCPLNFTSGRSPDKSHILDIDVLNTTLVTINRLFLKSWTLPAPPLDRIMLAKALGLNFK